VVYYETAAAGGPDLGPGRTALGPDIAAEPSKSGVSIRAGGGTEASSREATPQGGV
jgi:hypothetical protein